LKVWKNIYLTKREKIIWRCDVESKLTLNYSSSVDQKEKK